MTEAKDNGLARKLITLFEERRTAEFAKAAQAIAQGNVSRLSIQSALLAIVKGERAFEDIRTRDSAIKIIALLGFSSAVDVRRELFEVFTTFFDRTKLIELAAFEALPKAKQCGTQCSEMRLLRSLLRGLLCVKEEPGLTAGRLVIEVFDGTDFAGKVAVLLNTAT
jgi:hypothetical protein